jgi:sulfur transfer protein SufE
MVVGSNLYFEHKQQENTPIVYLRVMESGVVCGILAELLNMYSGLTETKIGQLSGSIDYGAVHQLRRRRSRACT